MRSTSSVRSLFWYSTMLAACCLSGSASAACKFTRGSVTADRSAHALQNVRRLQSALGARPGQRPVRAARHLCAPCPVLHDARCMLPQRVCICHLERSLSLKSRPYLVLTSKISMGHFFDQLAQSSHHSRKRKSLLAQCCLRVPNLDMRYDGCATRATRPYMGRREDLQDGVHSAPLTMYSADVITSAWHLEPMPPT